LVDIVDTNVILWGFRDLKFARDSVSGRMWMDVATASRAFLLHCYRTGECVVPPAIVREAMRHRVPPDMIQRMNIYVRSLENESIPQECVEQVRRILERKLYRSGTLRRLVESGEGDREILLLACARAKRGERVRVVTGDYALTEALEELARSLGLRNLEIVKLVPSPKSASETRRTIVEILEEAAREDLSTLPPAL